MVEPTAHNGSDAGSTPASPTNLTGVAAVRWLIENRANRHHADDEIACPWLDAMLEHLELILDLAEEGMKPVCVVDVSRAPAAASGYMLSNIADRIKTG